MKALSHRTLKSFINFLILGEPCTYIGNGKKG